MSFKLLPKSTDEFSDTKFWEGFFKTRGSKAFEWYGEYQDMVELWAQYAKPGDRVLNIGCGNSELGAELHDRQGCEVLCVDTSATVVQQMSRKHCSDGRRPRLAYRVMDAARLEGLEDGSFACAVDKGTLDAMISSAEAASLATVDAMLAEAHRVLRVGGRHLIVSLCQRPVVDKLIEHISLRPWIARVHQAAASEASSFPLPVFFIALTKLRPTPATVATSSLVQVQDAYSTGPPERLDSAGRLADWIRQTQLATYALARPASAAAAGETRFVYACGRTGLPAFTCRLVTHASPSRRRAGYAVFIEPLGDQPATSTTTEQRRDLLESQASLRRLLFVRLHPWLHYESDAALQASLSRLVMAFAPRPGMPESEVPFLGAAGRLAYPYATVAREGRHLVELASPGELRLMCPDSDLVALQCRMSVPTEKPDPGAHLLEALLSTAQKSAAIVGCPCDLDWLAGPFATSCSPTFNRPAAESGDVSVRDLLLANRFGLEGYRAAQPLAGPRRRLVVLFPPADSLAAYLAAISPESLAGLADTVDTDGRLVIATRLFDKKPRALEANATAADALHRSGRFAEVVCASFNGADCEGGYDEEEDDDEQRLRYWVVCASLTVKGAARATEFLTRLPGVELRASEREGTPLSSQ